MKKEVVVEKVVEEVKKVEKPLSLVEKARLFWAKSKQASPFEDVPNPISINKG